MERTIKKLLWLKYSYDQRVIIKVGIDEIAEIEWHNSEVDVSMGKIIGEDHIMSTIIGMTLEETSLRDIVKLQRSKF